MSDPIDLLIVPTAGLDTVTGLAPLDGRQRLDTAAALLKNGKALALAIVGGRRRTGPSEADAHAAYFRSRHRGLADKLAIVSAPSTCTNRDLEAVEPELRRYLKSVGKNRSTAIIGTVSYDKHLAQISIVLRALGYRRIRTIPTTSKPHYEEWQLERLIAVTRQDPFWRKTVQGRMLAGLANRRLNQCYLGTIKK